MLLSLTHLCSKKLTVRVHVHVWPNVFKRLEGWRDRQLEKKRETSRGGGVYSAGQCIFSVQKIRRRYSNGREFQMVENLKQIFKGLSSYLLFFLISL